MKQIYFLSGLSRSGSTLLGSILNHSKTIHVTPTSPFLDLLNYMNGGIKNSEQQYTFDSQKIEYNIYKGMFNSFYQNIDKNIIFDKHRGWVRNIQTASSFVENEFKGIVTYRPIPEIMVSFLTLMKNDPDNFIDANLKKDGKRLSLYNRCKCMWDNYISDIHLSTSIGLEYFPEKILPISYDDITSDPQKVLDRICLFFNFDENIIVPTGDIENTCGEAKDEAWGLKNLHTIRPKIIKVSEDPRTVLGDELFEFYSEFNLKI